jgi:hypothetical protein
LDLLTPLGTTSYYSATADLHTSQFTTAPAKPFPACCVLTCRSLVTASNSGGSSASRAQILLPQPPVQNSCQSPQSQLPTANSGTLNPILCCNCQLSRCHVFSVFLNSSTLDCYLKKLSQSFGCRFSTDSVIPSAGLGSSLYSFGVDPTENTVSNNFSIVACVFVAAGTCLPSRCLAMDVSYGSTIPAFRRHVIVCYSGWYIY